MSQITVQISVLVIVGTKGSSKEPRRNKILLNSLTLASIISSGYGPCGCLKSQRPTLYSLIFKLSFITMAEDSTVHKLHVEKLIADGSNWVTYRDRMLWALRSRRLSDHLTSTTVTQTYSNIGTVNNITPEMRWANDEATAMYTIAASIPNSVFTNIKSKTTMKAVRRWY
jgi:hypothetical protein